MALLVRRLRARVCARGGEERGLSLVELLVVVGISVVVMSVTGNALITSITSQRQQTAQLQSLNEIKLTFERLTRDVRGANPLQEGLGDSIQIMIDREGNRHDITYTVVGDEIVRTEEVRDIATNASQWTAEHVVLRGLAMPSGEPVFRYFQIDPDEDDAFIELTLPVDVRGVGLVHINLMVLPAEAARPIELRNEVRLRNA